MIDETHRIINLVVCRHIANDSLMCPTLFGVSNTFRGTRFPALVSQIAVWIGGEGGAEMPLGSVTVVLTRDDDLVPISTHAITSDRYFTRGTWSIEAYLRAVRIEEPGTYRIRVLGPDGKQMISRRILFVPINPTLPPGQLPADMRPATDVASPRA